MLDLQALLELQQLGIHVRPALVQLGEALFQGIPGELGAQLVAGQALEDLAAQRVVAHARDQTRLGPEGPRVAGEVRRRTAELAAAFGSLAREDPTALRAVVLAGDGPTFSAGADIGWMRAAMELDVEGNEQDAMAMADMFEATGTCPVPGMARAQGAAPGGGVGLAAAAALVVAEYLGDLFPALAGRVVPLACAVTIALALLQWHGIRWGSALQNFTTALKALAFLALIAAIFILAPAQRQPAG